MIMWVDDVSKLDDKQNFSEDLFDEYILVDGLQRLCAIMKYVNGVFKLPQNTKVKVSNITYDVSNCSWKELVKDFPTVANRQVRFLYFGCNFCSRK